MSIRLGLLGGTFNPPHAGHVACARAAAMALGLDHVALVPVGIAPHKQVAGDPGGQARADMCRLAVEGEAHLSVCTVEIERPGPSYTIDTLRALHEEEPERELTLIVGADAAQGFAGWKEPAAILGLARLAVAERAEVGRPDVLATLTTLPAAGGRVEFFAMPPVAVSSSLVRDRIAASQPVERLVADAVAGYISHHGLYHP